MTLHTTYKESVELFDKKFKKLYDEQQKKNVENLKATTGKNWQTYPQNEAIKTHLHTHTLKMLDVQIAWMEGEKKDTLEEAKKGITAAQATAGYNIALKDSITHLQEQRALIEFGDKV